MAASFSPSNESSLVQTVLDAFDTLFNKRDYAAAERFWSRATSSTAPILRPAATGCSTCQVLPATLRYENHYRGGDGGFVILHGRFTGHGRPAAWIAADILRMEDGNSRSTGMSSRTKPRGSNRAAVSRCSAINSRIDRDRHAATAGNILPDTAIFAAPRSASSRWTTERLPEKPRQLRKPDSKAVPAHHLLSCRHQEYPRGLR